MSITEPVTMLTDYALGVVGLGFGIALLRRIDARNRGHALLWGLGFLAAATAAFTGGTYHGFVRHLEEATALRLWDVTVFLMGATLAFFTSAIHAARVRRDSLRWLVAGVLLSLVGIGVQQTRFRAELDFNHNDAYHLIQAGALYLFFRGARVLEDRACV